MQRFVPALLVVVVCAGCGIDSEASDELKERIEIALEVKRATLAVVPDPAQVGSKLGLVGCGYVGRTACDFVLVEFGRGAERQRVFWKLVDGATLGSSSGKCLDPSGWIALPSEGSWQVTATTPNESCLGELEGGPLQAWSQVLVHPEPR